MLTETLDRLLVKITTRLPDLTKDEFFSGLELLEINPSKRLIEATELIEERQKGYLRLINRAPVFNQHTLPIAFHLAYWWEKVAPQDPPFYGSLLNGRYSVEDLIISGEAHDLVEDKIFTEEELLETFEQDVHSLVMPVTKPELPYLKIPGKGRETELEYKMRREAAGTGQLMRGPKLSIVIRGADGANNGLCLSFGSQPALKTSYIDRTLAYRLHILPQGSQYFAELNLDRLSRLGVTEDRINSALRKVMVGVGD